MANLSFGVLASLLAILASSISVQAVSSISLPVLSCAANSAYSAVPTTSLTAGGIEDTPYSNCCSVADGACKYYIDSEDPLSANICADTGPKWYCATSTSIYSSMRTSSSSLASRSSTSRSTSIRSPTTTATRTRSSSSSSSSPSSSSSSRITSRTTSPTNRSSSCTRNLASGTACILDSFNIGCRAPTVVPTKCPATVSTACGSVYAVTSGCTTLNTATCGSTGFVNVASFKSTAFSSTITVAALATASPVTTTVATAVASLASSLGLTYPSQLAVVSRGYFIPPCSGLYSFTAPAVTSGRAVDDIFYMWFGAPAYTGWTSSNYALYATYSSIIAGTYYVNLVGGSFYPIRWLYVNTVTGNAYYEMDINYLPTGHSGVKTTVPIASSFTTCDPAFGAPPFPNWGSEALAAGLLPDNYPAVTAVPLASVPV